MGGRVSRCCCTQFIVSVHREARLWLTELTELAELTELMEAVDAEGVLQVPLVFGTDWK